MTDYEKYHPEPNQQAMEANKAKPNPMRTIGQVIAKPKPPAERPALTAIEVDIVDYVFLKIKSTWGDIKYWQQFTSEETLELTKIDWAHDLLSAIGTRRDNRETPDEFAHRKKMRVDKIFTEIRHLSENEGNKGFEWPQLKKICSYMANFRDHPSHRQRVPPSNRLEDDSVRTGRKRAGRENLDKMKGLFDG